MEEAHSPWGEGVQDWLSASRQTEVRLVEEDLEMAGKWHLGMRMLELVPTEYLCVVSEPLQTHLECRSSWSCSYLAMAERLLEIG